ncbi:hypothetical protein IWX81_002698 [Salinibacterium sp. CAN_S4]|uniref:ribbon-helix-helix domain-containing protein n=1 Tax=Salinibacterium sp. CAN_S4 TaxID=2787727 RepID=UPI0018EF869A
MYGTPPYILFHGHHIVGCVLYSSPALVGRFLLTTRVAPLATYGEEAYLRRMTAHIPEPEHPQNDPHRMVRTTVFLPTSVVAGVRVVAKARGTSSAGIIRAAVESAVGGYRPPPRGGFL